MTRDGEIPTIFNPLSGRNRTPSVIITDENVANGPFGNADSLTSQHEISGERLPIQTPSSNWTGKLKNCSASFCSKSAQKVSYFICPEPLTNISIQL